MAVLLSPDHLLLLRERLKRLRPVDQHIYRVLSSIDCEVETCIGLQFWVDTWPVFNAVLVEPAQALQFEDRYCFWAKTPSDLNSLIKSPDIVHWMRYPTFRGYHKTFAPMLREMAEERDVRLCDWGERHLLEARPRDLITNELPPGYVLDVVRKTDVDQVHQERGMAFDLNSKHYISYLIDHSLHVAIRDDEDNLAAYEFVYNTGEMGMLYVVPAHRRRGLAKVAVAALAHKLADCEKPIFSFVKAEASIKVHLACGFRITDEFGYNCTTCLPPGSKMPEFIEL